MSFVIEPDRSQCAYIASRYASTLVLRTRLFLRTKRIGRQLGLDPVSLKDALGAQRVYLELRAFEPAGHDAPELLDIIMTTYHVQVVELSRCSTLIRYGLLRGSLPRRDYDAAEELCGRIRSAEILLPFLSLIERHGKRGGREQG
ncbi:hypothetical protein AB0A63_13915 [Lentzea sp. NPDC042327]|uniref:hypothetical protein n=1 Tax=Lentzea sp. NPDC042327 TaxID=3154801 RepID=UPI0033ED7088